MLNAIYFKISSITAMWLFSLHTVECKKVDVCDCYYTVITNCITLWLPVIMIIL